MRNRIWTSFIKSDKTPFIHQRALGTVMVCDETVSGVRISSCQSAIFEFLATGEMLKDVREASCLCLKLIMSWIKINQLDVTCFIISLFTAQHVSNVSTSIFRSLRLTVDLAHVLYCSVRIEVLALASLFIGEWLVVTCVAILISVFL